MKLLKYLSAIVITTVTVTPFYILLFYLEDEQVPELILIILLLMSMFIAFILMSKLWDYVDNKIRKDLEEAVTKAEKRGADKLVELLQNDMQINAIIDVEIPYINEKGKELGNQYVWNRIYNIINHNY